MRATRFRCLPQKFYLHEGLGAKIAKVVEPSERLFDSLLGGLPELVGAPGLYLSADGALDFIPFQALKRNPAGPYPVEDHTLTYLTEAVVPAGSETPGGNKRIPLVGNPDRTLPAVEDEARAIDLLPAFQAGNPQLRFTATLDGIDNY